MNIINPKDILIELTRLNPFERFVDGRPRVPDDLLTRLETATTEQAWGVLRKHGYNFQFEGNWLQTHPEKILVGRCVTAMMLPFRPDYHNLVQETGVSDGRIGGQNSWVIDTLVEDDVLVVDLFGKIKNGTFVGDNLSTAIQSHTKRRAILDCGIRDYQGIRELTESAFFCRGVDPTAIADVTLAGINIPIRIGEATVLPGDVVLGTPTGVIFIPPHLIQEVVETAENIQLRDIFGKYSLSVGKYTPGEIDVPTWPQHIEGAYQEWLKTR
ncbi:MAG: RraA family protein [Chloroflexota bacterium]